MKILLTMLALAACMYASATEWLTYYVYHETEYSQGPWKRAGMTEGSGYRYLVPQAYEDLFGSGDEQLAAKLLSRLKAKKPALYSWEYRLSVKGDTVVVTGQKQPGQAETIRNEITATLVLNNFGAVTFSFGNESQTWTIDDLTLPYFDLVTKQPVTTVTTRTTKQVVTKVVTDDKNPLKIWLIISIVLNIVCFGVLIINQQKK